MKVTNLGPYPLRLQVPGAGREIALELGSFEVDRSDLRLALGWGKTRKIFEAQCVLDNPQPEGEIDAPTGPVQDITELTTRAAEKAISECSDMARLKSWAAQDSRKAIRKAAHLRWRDLVASTPEADSKVTFG